MASNFPLNALGLSHQCMDAHVREGAFCIDATAGKGRDTLFLCRLVGDSGRVLALDIQADAVAQTTALLTAEGVAHRAQVVQDCHSHLGDYAAPDSVDGIMFNFGWLPGGDHTVFSHPESSIPAINAGLELLKSGGVMTLCIYHGKETGYEEKEALLPFLKTIDPKQYSVLFTDFINRTGDVPIAVLIKKD